MSFTRPTSRIATGLGVVGASVFLLAGPASADTARASATAARVSLGGTSLFDTGVVSASNDGTTQTVSGAGGTVLLGGQTLLTLGVLAQNATAATNGTSAACAGAVGAGGTIQVGTTAPCTATIGTPNGVTLNLGNGILPAVPLVPNIFGLRADAIYAECTANTTGATGSATLVNANIFQLLTGTPLPTNPTVNQTINILNLATITLNEQSTTAGTLTVRALHLALLPNLGLGSLLPGLLPGNQAVVDVIIGEAKCGPNARTTGVSLVGGPALPVAFATAAGVGGLFLVRRRRQTV